MRQHLRYRIPLGIIFFLIAFFPQESGSAEKKPVPARLLIDNFENTAKCELDRAWNMRNAWKFDEVPWKTGSKIYSVKSDGTNRFLHASTEGNSNISALLVRLVNSHKVVKGEKVQWDLKTHPYLSWRWRVHRLPTGANEKKGKLFDNAAAVFVVFVRYDLPVLPWNWQPIDVLQYTWSTTIPQGQQFQKKAKRFGFNLYEGKFYAIESGSSKAGYWVQEKRNILQDYRDRFGHNPGSNPILIALITDSDKTKSVSIADYDDFCLESK